jgi:hypothetical protein
VLKNERSYACTPPICLQGVAMDKFTFTFTLSLYNYPVLGYFLSVHVFIFQLRLFSYFYRLATRYILFSENNTTNTVGFLNRTLDCNRYNLRYTPIHQSIRRHILDVCNDFIVHRCQGPQMVWRKGSTIDILNIDMINYMIQPYYPS